MPFDGPLHGSIEIDQCADQVDWQWLTRAFVPYIHPVVCVLSVSQDSKVVVSALMKLAGGSPSFSEELNVEAFLEQVGGGRQNEMM